MKLTLDCARSVMLELESFPFGSYSINDFSESIEKHGEGSVVYTLAKLSEGGYINALIDMTESGYYHCGAIYCLTFDGHQFLETIRQPDVWKKLSNAAKLGGVESFKVIAEVSSEIGKNLLLKKFGLL